MNLSINLTASGTRFDLSGKRVWGQSYNGSFVAPTIHLRPGGSATVTLANHLPVATNLHFHGMHISPADDSDNSLLCIPPGKTLHYRLSIPANHPIGTFWYHSHAMGKTCDSHMASMPGMAGAAALTRESPAAFTPAEVENQVFAGLSGALIVGDDRTLLPPSLRHIIAHTFVFKDVQVDKTGHIVQNTPTTSINSNNPTVRLVNGQLRPVLTMRPGSTQLWRLVNAGADIFYQLHLDGYRLRVVGEDGRPVARVTTADTLLLPPAKRYDALVTAAAHPGKAWLRTTAYSNGPQGDNYPDVPLTRINVAGPAERPVADALPAGATVPTTPLDLSRAHVAQRRTLQLSEDSTGTIFYINGKQFSMDSSIFSTPAKLGTVEEWTILNTTGEVHPFHLHTNGFQVMSSSGGQTDPNRKDTFPIPFQANGVPGKVVIRVHFADYTGDWMFHCHIAAHEDNGMMSFIRVVP